MHDDDTTTTSRALRTRPSAKLALFGCVLAAIAVASDPPAAVVEDWPEFRGPRGDGRSSAEGLPLTWSETEHVTWKTPIPGRGWSTPVVLGDQVWLTTATPDGHRLSALLVQADDGRIAREVLVFEVDRPEPIDPTNSYASPSPVIESGRVFVHFGTYGTACLDTTTGEKLWQRRDLTVDHQKGPGSSPVLLDDVLILQCDGNDVQYVIGLDKRTGRTVWKTRRSLDLSAYHPDYRKSFSTPLVADVAGESQLITLAAHGAFGHDPATGRERWRLRYPGHTNVARPVASDGVIFFSTGYASPQLWAVRLGGRGELSANDVLWTHRRSAPIKPSPVVADGRVYTVADGTGIATCLDAASGAVLWTRRLGGTYSASPVVADGRIYFSSEDGKTTVIALGAESRVLAVNELDAGFRASPAIAGQAFYLRTVDHLYRVER